MAALVGGIGALVLGFILLVLWWSHFLSVLAGLVPVVLLLGGALAAYLGLEEIKDQRQIESEKSAVETSPAAAPTSQDELERVKQETEKYKAEVEDLKRKLQELGGKKEEV